MSCGSCCKCTCWVILYILTCWFINCKGFWRFANEWDIECEHEPLPAKEGSGVKVLLAGWAKSGTWTLSHSLGQLGINAYHSQEFLSHVWSPIADEYWMKPGPRTEASHGTTEVVQRVTKNSPLHLIAMNGGPVQDDKYVLDNLKPERLAKQFSKCRVDAVALDGIEKLHVPIIEASPNIKVLMLDWREHEKWSKSLQSQMLFMVSIWLVAELFYSSLHFLPYGLAVKAIDPLINNDIEKLLKTGTPPFIQQCPIGVMMWHPFVKNRQIYSHWFMGLAWEDTIENKTRYDDLFKAVKAKVPEKNILHWDFKKKGWEDLCAFLGVKPCPKSGKLATEPNGYKDIFKKTDKGYGRGWEFNCDEPFILIPVFLILHFINFKIFKFIVGLPGRLFGGGKEKGKKD